MHKCLTIKALAGTWPKCGQGSAKVVAKVVATICKCLVIKHLIFSRKMRKVVDGCGWCLYAISTMKFVNLTPHDITVIMGDQADRKTFAKSGTIARVSQETTVVRTVDGINISTATFGPVVGLPEPSPDTLLIVSGMVKSAATGRTDLVSPGDLVRDAAGVVLGCRGFFC